MDTTKPAQVTVQTTVNASREKVWQCWTEPQHIKQWNFAIDTWHCPYAENDLREGGKFSARMEAKDGSMGFDFSGTYDEVIPYERIIYTMSDGRKVFVDFSGNTNTHIKETFDAELQNSIDMQRTGWQAILDNFRDYVESK